MNRGIPSLISFSLFFACLNAGCPAPKPTAGPQVVDPAAKSKFAAGGIDLPATQMTAKGRNAGELDLALIREAIAEAKELSEEEQAKLQDVGSDEDQEVAAAEAPAERRRAVTPRSAPRMEPPPPPSPKPAPDSNVAAVMAPAKKPAKAMAFDFADSKKDDSGGDSGADEPSADGADPKKTVLKQVAAAPREAKILVRNEEGKLTPMSIRELRVVSYLQGPRARTVVDTVFENKTDRQLQGTFYFPLPADASPVGFAMFSAAVPADAKALFDRGRSLPRLPDDSSAAEDMNAFAPIRPAQKAKGADWLVRQEARVVEQKRAREVYEEIVRQSIDPALLEWSGGNTFQARVFPIGARSLKRVVLVYEQTLAFDGEFLRYTFPLPEKKLGAPVSARVHVDESLGNVSAATMSADLRAVKPKGKKLGAWTVFDLIQEGTGGALSVAVRPVESGGQVIAGPDPGGLAGRTFFARLVPQVPEGVLDRTGRAVFVVDTSLSAEDNQAHQLQSAMLEALLNGDDSVSEYAVLLFDVRPRWLHGPGYRKNTEQNRAQSLAELRKIYLEGATNFDALLADLDDNLSWIGDGDRPPTAFLLSDGQITWGLTDVSGLIKKHPSASKLRWVCYRFGENAVNQNLFDSLTRDTAGRTVTVLSQAEIPAAVSAHRKAAAVIQGVAAEGSPVSDLVLAGNPKLVFPGQELQLAGRLTGQGPATIVVRAVMAGKALSFKAVIPVDSTHRMAPRAFGELFTRRLLSLDDERLDKMIVALSQHYLLANERASLLILEDAASFERYQIEKVQVDLADLEQLRLKEEDQRVLKLQGLDLDDAPALARDVVRGLERLGDSLTPPMRAQPLVEAPFAGGEERLQAELAYRDARSKDKLDVMVYDAVARTRALAGDTMGAVRALSCTVELRPRDTEATRLVGYGLLALGQFQPAAELFERSRLVRPFEAQAYLEEALALDGSGRMGQAARRYEIVLSRSWRRHEHEVKTVATYHLARLLNAILASKALKAPLRDQVKKRLDELMQTTGTDEIDYQFTTHWSTDSIDIDLWVIEPDGTKCYYGHQETELGGKLHWDITDGLGPELYHMKKAARGQYVVAVHYYGNNSSRLAVPTSLLLVSDRDVFGPEDRYTRRIQMRMLPKRDAVLELRRERL